MNLIASEGDGVRILSLGEYIVAAFSTLSEFQVQTGETGDAWLN